MSELLCKINSLAIFRGLSESEPLASLREFLKIADDVSETRYNVLEKYTKFVKALYSIRQDGDLAAAIWNALKYDSNPLLDAYLKMESARIRGKEPIKISTLLKTCADKELNLINEIALISYADVEKMLAYEGYVAQFKTTGLDIKDKYMKMLENITKSGFGMYADYAVFRSEHGNIIPVKYPDRVKVDGLFGYENERSRIIENTKEFVKGQPFADILLYGESGTGKTATVKAIARLFAQFGVRLVSVSKDEMSDLIPLIEKLSLIPMKFILLLDDIIEDVSKLESAITSSRQNIVIYATTSNEQTNLIGLFGLNILFNRPDKAEYLRIAHKICDARGIKIGDEESFEVEAEKLASAEGGRSARAARRFVDLMGR